VARRKSIKLSTAQDTRSAITRIANRVLNDEIDLKAANIILYACNAVLGAIRVDEQQQKLDELERLVTEQKKRR
jgi:hypothetical protein